MVNGLWWWVVVVWVAGLGHMHGSGCFGWVEEERIALLQIKASFSLPDGYFRPSWNSGAGEKRNCCEWDGFRCNSAGRVRMLSLDSARDYAAHNWYINSSLFLPFTELTHLYLSWNGIVGWVEHEGFERLSALKKLENLNLDGNSFNNTIFSTLPMLSSLKYLSICNNKIEGWIDTKAFYNMSILEVLDLRDNRINGFTSTQDSEGLSSLRNLVVLKLDSNLLDINALTFLGSLSLSSLKALSIRWNLFNGSINVEDFYSMSSLEALDLSHNGINGFSTPKGFKRLSTLQNLEALYLDSISSNDSIFSFVGTISSLKTLSIRSYSLHGSIDFKGLERLSQLQRLYLDYSYVNMSILYDIGSLTSLRVLSLRGNNFIGGLPNRGWCELSNLWILDLSDNSFSGELVSCMQNLRSVQVLILYSNQFTGNIATSPLTNLTSLEYLVLSDNHFVIPTSFAAFSNHSKMKSFMGSNNILSDEKIHFQTAVSRFQFEELGLSHCQSNHALGLLPHFLLYQHDLRYLDLSNNNFEGGFLFWLLVNNTRLVTLNIRNNSFTGPLLLPSHPNPNIFQFDISDNHFQGQIPPNISHIVPNLVSLNMSRNDFQGNIPASLGDMQSLRDLDLSNNKFSGQIPQHLTIGCRSLSLFKLSNNNLDGQILPKHVNLTNLNFLYLDNNHFVGKIPESLSTSLYLEALDISNNNMSGSLPGWMGNLSSLNTLVVSNNHFEGPIPEFYKLSYLVVLYMSNNNLSGSIPSCLNSPQITHIHLSRNKLTGPLTPAFYNSSTLVTLDLGYNNLTGNIPSWLPSLSKLSILLLKSNHFEGHIPAELCHLKRLSILDLSQNNLSGSIPPCFSDLSFNASQKSPVPRTFIASSFSSPELPPQNESRLRVETHSMGNDDYSLYPVVDVQEEVEFTTKSIKYAYKGSILDYMSGVDLSFNQLSGEIPPDIGKLSKIHALNLSHNNLTGSIPATFSKLSQIESLDLSYNSLNGAIPSQLLDLNFLAAFSVSHNNLSGRTPVQTSQFATFNESSYEGNPFLCGPPLHNNCTDIGSSPTESISHEDDDDFMDLGIFYISFSVSFTIAFATVVAVLFINPRWQQIIEAGATSLYYFVLDNLLKLFNARGL